MVVQSAKARDKFNQVFNIKCHFTENCDPDALQRHMPWTMSLVVGHHMAQLAIKSFNSQAIFTSLNSHAIFHRLIISYPNRPAQNSDG